MSDLTADSETLRRKLLELDIELRAKQAWWEHPRNAAVVLGVIVAFIATIAGVVGFQLGRSPQPVIVQFGAQPLHIQIERAP